MLWRIPLIDVLAVAGLIPAVRGLHEPSVLLPLQPHPHPFSVVLPVASVISVCCRGAGAVAGGKTAAPPAARVRSLLWMPDLPLVDIAWRRARDAARPLMAGVPATELARIPADALVADEDAVAVPFVPEFADAVNPALPVVLIARRRASARSRELMLLAVCAIVNPVA
jgi:hypothetical protein